MPFEDLKRDIQYLKGVGEKRARLFNKLGIFCVGALLDFFPRAYEDWSNPKKLSECSLGQLCCIKARVMQDVKLNYLKGQTALFTTTVSDGESVFWVKIFNNKYAASALKCGQEYLFYGKPNFGRNGVEMISPQIAPASCDDIKPIYRSVAGLNSKAIAKTVKTALSLLPDDDFLPQHLIEKYRLMPRKIAVENIHFPKNSDSLAQARRRLVFEELFLLQCGLFLTKSVNKSQSSHKIEKDYTKEFCDALPFELTDAQSAAIKDCVEDMKQSVPMNRLVQGDVGSGKTAVAAALCYTAAKNGFQAALMAPTEILATQHYNTLCRMLGSSKLSCALLTGSTPKAAAKDILKRLKNGEIDIITGTHALLTDKVEFNKLGLVITDEQHRFGVNQRNALSSKGVGPHVMVMSATPIPRTLGLIIYGDLDLSIINQSPKGRAAVNTYLIDSQKKQRAYGFIKGELDKGHKAYIVCPLIEESDSPLIPAKEYYEQLKKGEFSSYKVALLHGKMNAKEKATVMENFVNGDTQLLVCTTVIEVGVDVPTATVMMIEDAHRYGLSQLHQLRGRIGRSSLESYCILICDNQNQETLNRLKTFTKTRDGFEIAEKDLALRGPGDFLGSRQHGLPNLKIADISCDIKILKCATDEASAMFKSDKNFDDYPALKAKIKSMFSQTLTI